MVLPSRAKFRELPAPVSVHAVYLQRNDCDKPSGTFHDANESLYQSLHFVRFTLTGCFHLGYLSFKQIRQPRERVFAKDLLRDIYYVNSNL